MKILFRDHPVEVSLRWGRYNNNNTALVAFKGNEVYAKLSLNPGEDLLPDEICIKNYSENMGVLESLVANGVLSNPIGHIAGPGGMAFPVCKILDRTKGMKLSEEF